MAGPEGQARIEVVALVASAGGLDALSVVLRGLPADLPAAVVVQQHLGGQASVLPRILGRRLGREVVWAVDRAVVAPGRVTVCPPRTLMEILPDRTCSLRRLESAGERRLDGLLTSLADSVGPRALAVVLTGGGSDGAAGTAALTAAGGVVIAQSEDTAEHPSMPRAAAAAGADLVLPLHEIAGVVADVVRGGPLPRPNEELGAIRATFGDQGEIAVVACEIAWARTPLGAVQSWPPLLRSTMRLAQDTPHPVVLYWGDQLIYLPNEAAVPIAGGRVRERLGRPIVEAFPELSDEPISWVRRAQRGEPVHRFAGLVPVTRGGTVRDGWFDMSYTPIWQPDGTVAGVHVVSPERTQEVLAARRLETLNALARASRGNNRRKALGEALTVLNTAPDISFAAAYLLDPMRGRAGLVGVVGVEAGRAMAPRELRLVPGGGWPLHQVQEQGPVVIEDVATRFRGHTVGPEQLTPECAVLHPLRDEAEDRMVGVLVLGTHPRLPLDDRYREFLTVAAETVGIRAAESHARHRERERLDKLAELDRAKTEFFSNISHEFRTPLTLMLGPLEEMLADADWLPAEKKDDLELIRRNARRLLRLVDTLLDFSQLEAGRLRAWFVPTDLAERTREIVGQFESAAARAGVELRGVLEPLPGPVWVDPEMWEKIVSNLLANALKFTFDGSIEVVLRALPQHAELLVRDTGVGIPAEEQPFIFERFHRVRGSRARTDEGAGIGLALVDELVRRHHGRIRVASAVGEGTTFTVWIPLGPRPSSPDDPPVRPTADAPEVAAAMAEEAASWDRGSAVAALNPSVLDTLDHGSPAGVFGQQAPRARVLVVDDNADMRDYLARLLSDRWQVTTAGHGTEALELARRDRPDLVLADVMMPGLDGFGLVAAIRADQALGTVPVVLVTARAGEDSGSEGRFAGADDYLIKPFSARELLARVGAQLELSRIRRGTSQRQEFLLELSDALRPLDDPNQIQAEASRVLGRHLGVSRVLYRIVSSDGEYLDVAASYIPDRQAPLIGSYPIRDHGEQPAAALRQGRTIAVSNVSTSPLLTPEERAAHHQLGIAALASVPLVKNGRLVADLAVHHSEPRPWQPGEITLIEETAERTWAALERVRAEAALRASQERLRRVLETDAVGVFYFDPRTGAVIDANDVFLRMTGYTRDEMERGDLTWQRMTPPEWTAMSEQQMHRLATTGRIGPYEKEYLLKDGSRRWMLFAGRDLGDGTACKFCIDTTDLNQAEDPRQPLTTPPGHLPD